MKPSVLALAGLTGICASFAQTNAPDIVSIISETHANHTLQLEGDQGHYFNVEVSTNLINWSELGRNTIQSNEFILKELNATEPMQVYRTTNLEKPCFECTHVIGFSQTGNRFHGWFIAGGAFEATVDGDRWQLQINSGGSVQRWKDPNYEGWNARITSPCTTNTDTPDRVLFTISGNHREDIDGWVTDLHAFITTLTNKHPSVTRVILQPTVGGPNHQVCVFQPGNDGIRASELHPYIDEAISIVVQERFGTHPEVVAGLSPEVNTCDDYGDPGGHFTTNSGAIMGAKIGTYYNDIDSGACTSP